MADSNYNPETPFSVEVYETAQNGKPRTFGVKDLTFKQAKEYFDRMKHGSKFQFFRMQPDGSKVKYEFGPIGVQFGIWKSGFVSTAGEYRSSVLMEVCESEEDAEARLKSYDNNHFIEPF